MPKAPQPFIGRKAVSGYARNDPDETILDPRDDIGTQVLKFLKDKLSPADLSKVDEILSRDDLSAPAMDHRRPRVAMDAEARLRYEQRFPNANRLGWSR
jgi:hypothetical protein